MYDVLLPSFIAGFAAFTTAQFFGTEYRYYDINFYRSFELDLNLIYQVVLAGLFFGIIAFFFITMVNLIEKYIKKLPYNRYKIAFVAGIIMVILSLIISDKYLGLGLLTISDALDPTLYASDNISWYDFILKTFFTSLTLGAGGSGGIITPIFFVGTTNGVTFGHLIGGDHIALFAALGFVSVLAGTTNTPIASIIMAVELFGVHMANYAGLSVVIAFLITGHRSVFHSQRLSLRKADNINIEDGQDMGHTDISLNMKDIKRVKDFGEKIKPKRFKWKKKYNNENNL
jgi:H+/Cl- antiporter ClcA